jgi:predicted TIM-barrel fold metal-dependent hydrolase
MSSSPNGSHPGLPDRIISSDDHMDLNVLPVDLWTARLPANLRERAPRVVDTPEGPCWQADGKLLGPSGRKIAGAIDRHQLGFRPGNPKLRLEDLDRDGVYSSVIYGPPKGIPFPDRDLADACLRAYNDWADDFNATDRNRLIVLALLPSHALEPATRELERVAKLGHRGAVFNLHESPEPVFFEGWEKFWATANEVGIPIHFHLGGGVHSLNFRAQSWAYPAHVTVSGMQLDEAASAMVFSGILERHPRVKVVLAEAGLGWLPYIIERMDYEFKKYYDVIKDYRLKELPSFYWRRQMYATYEEEEFGLEHVDRIGAENVMWASDYPHGDMTWPNSRKAILDSHLGKLDGKTRQAIVCDNAARLYGIA